MKKYLLSFCLVFIILFILWIIRGNIKVETTNISISNEKIPEGFNGFTIAHISDLHNARFGKDNAELLKKIKAASPDIIIITGDLIDSRHTNISVGTEFAVNALKIAPVYYVNGNHESRLSEYKDIENELLQAGVNVLINKTVEIQRFDDKITISGIEDPAFYSLNNSENTIKNLLKSFKSESDYFSILLSHRPEAFDAYAESKFNLVFSGHAHGGQFRIPFAGGILAPGQGLFPKYDSGLYSEGDTSMIVSRGLGNSIFPFRLNNNPEIIIAKLYNK